MAPDRSLHEHIYLTLKSLLLSREFKSGQRIDIADLADRFRASVTPVRDCLCRLVGENVVEMLPTGGFRLSMPTADALRDLYHWNAQHLLAALHANPLGGVCPLLASAQLRMKDSREEPGALVATLFQALADASANREFSQKVEAANARLFHVRRIEPTFVRDCHLEARRLANPAAANVQKAVRRRILAYHRRRILLARQIAERLSLGAAD